MKELFKNKKLMIGIAIGLVLIIGVVIYFGLRKAANKSGSSSDINSVSTKSETSTNVSTKQVADTSGGTISANSAASKGTLFV
jgi:capsule polysaccharide export protein KpsE/RkpR